MVLFLMRKYTQNSIQTFTDFSHKKVSSNSRREKLVNFLLK